MINVFIYFYTIFYTFSTISMYIQLSIFRTCTDSIFRVAKGGEFHLVGWWGSLVYIPSSRRTVRLGQMQGVYERFPKQKLIRQNPATHAGRTVQGRAPLDILTLWVVPPYQNMINQGWWYICIYFLLQYYHIIIIYFSIKFLINLNHVQSLYKIIQTISFI